PERIRIPSIGVDAAIIKVGLKGEGERKYMETPPGGENLAGWYSPKLPKGENPFPRPGEVGAAVIAGHVDSKEGADVFYRLKELQRGAEILRSEERRVGKECSCRGSRDRGETDAGVLDRSRDG